MRFGRIGVVLASIVLVTGTVACGSSSNKSSSGDGQSAASRLLVKPASGKVLKVGGIVEQLSFSGTDDGFKARIARANKNHELGEYTIDYIGSSDPAGSVDKTLAEVQSLVQRDHVFAIAPMLTVGFDQSVASYLAGQKIPTFGGGFTAGFCGTNYYTFSPIGCSVGPGSSYTTPQRIVAKALGKQAKDVRWGLLSLSGPGGQTLVNDYTKLVEAEGGKVVYGQAVVPQGAGGDLSPFVNAVKAAKPDVIWLLAGAEVISLSSALKAAGFDGAIVNSALYNPGLLAKYKVVADAIDGSIITTNTPVVEAGTPAIKKLVADYKAIGKSENDLTFGGFFGWESADIMVTLLKAAGPPYDKLVQAAANGVDYKPPFGANPLHWPEAWNEGLKCASAVKAEGTQYKVVVPFNCDGKRVKLR